MKSLNKLRKEIREIDNKLIELIKKRFDIANTIGKIKKENGLPLKNWEIEKEIIKRTRLKARELRISEDFMINLMQEIIRESCNVQELSHFMKFKGEKENIFIIGANGKMGNWFTEFFQIKGHNVLKHDIKANPGDKSYTDFENGLLNSSITLIATPVKVIPSIIDKIINFGYKGVVFDIASIKTYLIHSYKKALANGVSITSIHPLFGPSTKILSDKIICFCNLGNKYAFEKIRALFEDTAISFFETSVEEHDNIISYVLNLSHLINIIYINILTESGFDYKTLKSMGSTTFLSQMKTSASVITENPKIYFDIQVLNKYKESVLENLRTTTENIMKIIKNNDFKEFEEIMERGKKWVKE